MGLEERILSAKEDAQLRNDVIAEYMNFILSCAGKSAGRYITVEDEAASISMLAFDEAITKYDVQKGNFLNFATLIIKSRMTDYLRKEYKNKDVIPFSSLYKTDMDGNEKQFDIVDENAEISDAAVELYSIKQELEVFGFSFFDLPQATPKSKKTKQDCYAVINYILNDQNALNQVCQNGTIPTKKIMESLNVNQKLLERHRKYLIAAVIILSGDYNIISQYFEGVRKGGVV